MLKEELKYILIALALVLFFMFIGNGVLTIVNSVQNLRSIIINYEGVLDASNY